MLTYDFVCKDCNVIYEITQSIKNNFPTQCEFCECSDPELFYHQISEPYFFVKQEPNSVLWQADRNTQKIGYAELKERADKKKEQIRKAKAEIAAKAGGKVIQSNTEEKPFWREDISKVSNIRQYIETGAKS